MIDGPHETQDLRVRGAPSELGKGRRGMAHRRILHSVVFGALATVIGIGAVLLLGGAAAAPTTQGLVLQTSSHAGGALPGNGNEAYILVGIYNEAGPIRGIVAGSLYVAVVAAPSGAAPIKKSSVTEPVSGVYKIALAPELSSHRWASGRYVISITLTSANGSGVALADLVIEH